MSSGFGVGDWCWSIRLASPAQVIERQDVWGEVVYRVWLPATDAVVRLRAQELGTLRDACPSVDALVHAAAVAKLLDAEHEKLFLAPIQSNLVPLPHQLYALNRAMSCDRIRYLLADEVGLGKTIEAGLILRELKLRGAVRRALVVAPKGLVRQWQAEMRLHFGENFRVIEPSGLAAFRQWRDEGAQSEKSLWQTADQVICSLDSVKPCEGRRGWSWEQLAAYNRERFEDLISAGWDLVIIDESHRLGDSSERVARYKLGAALAEAAPYLLLLSATPHQGKSDQFFRLMQLLDREEFPDETAIDRDRVRPFVIRTEKRAAINEEGRPLFQPRVTRLQTVAWQSRHVAQRRLYEAVTDYVRHGYNQALAAKQRHIGFLMILMQRLVTSSTAAIRSTLERRLLLLEAPRAEANSWETPDVEEWAELDGQSQLDIVIEASGWEREKAEVENLLRLARESERAAADAKAAALLELLYKLQQEEGDPHLKILVFTEFVPTQAMLAEFLESRGFSTVRLNGGMDLDARTQAQQSFSRDAQVLVSTDAGGEGLNLQFCHIVVNFDMPWNPMRLEQRIGRVDRIGQSHAVRAINFVLEETVEYRVRQVLEEKLAIIANEFGVDKAADVMDSVETEPIFDALFVRSLQDPSAIDVECDAVMRQVREKIKASRNNIDLLRGDHALDAEEARKWRDHPSQHWLERAVTSGLPTKGGMAQKAGDAWRLRWSDGRESPSACFDARTAQRNPELEWITLEDSRARALVHATPRFVASQPVPIATISGLPETVRGIWSLWEIRLVGSHVSENFCGRRFLPVFLSDDGRSFVPTANRIWDLLLTEEVTVAPVAAGEEGSACFEASLAAAKVQGERLFAEIREEHRSWIVAERERARRSFQARERAMERIGLASVKNDRRKRFASEYEARMASLRDAEVCLPDLHAVLVLRIGTRGEARA